MSFFNGLWWRRRRTDFYFHKNYWTPPLVICSYLFQQIHWCWTKESILTKKTHWPVGQDLCPSSQVQEVEASFLDPLLLCLTFSAHRHTHTHTTLTKFQLISNASYHAWEDLPQLMLTRAQNQKHQKKTRVFWVLVTSSLQPRSSDFVAYPLQVVRPPRWAAHFSSRRAHTPWVWQSWAARN